MDYDPIKDRLIRYFEHSGIGQRLFFGILHLVFLRSWYVREALSGAVSSGARVLDAGTGFGQYTDWIARRWSDTTILAVDIKQVYLDRLERYVAHAGWSDRVAVDWQDLTRLDVEGPFDVVMAVDVMEHIEDDRAVFTHMHRVLRPGGLVIINSPSDQGGSDVHDASDESFIGEHVRDGYGEYELTEKLSDAGFETESVTWGYGPAGSMGWRLLVQIPMRLLGASMWLLPLVGLYYVVALPVGVLLNASDMAANNAGGTGITVVARKPSN